MIGKSKPPGSPAVVVDKAEEDLLRQLLRVPRWKLLDIPFDDDDDGENPRPMERGNAEFALIDPRGDRGGLLANPRRADGLRGRSIPGQILFADIGSRRPAGRPLRVESSAVTIDIERLY